jgi:hypothetical protein
MIGIFAPYAALAFNTEQVNFVGKKVRFDPVTYNSSDSGGLRNFFMLTPTATITMFPSVAMAGTARSKTSPASFFANPPPSCILLQMLY